MLNTRVPGYPGPRRGLIQALLDQTRVGPGNTLVEHLSMGCQSRLNRNRSWNVLVRRLSSREVRVTEKKVRGPGGHAAQVHGPALPRVCSAALDRLPGFSWPHLSFL